jgi:molecular chaperone GrpE
MAKDKDRGHGREQDPDETSEPVVRDKRRVDPETGEVREAPADAHDAAAGGAAPADPDLDHEQVVDTGIGDSDQTLSEDDLDVLSGQTTSDALAAERLADLQRVTAEYANYRKRTEAGREVEQERAVMTAAKLLLPVLDDLDRAQKHGDLDDESSAFSGIAAKTRGVAERLGLAPFGEAGEAFDPNVHEAIFQQHSDAVTVDTVADVVERGYTLGSTLVRAAKVVVSTPA